MFRVRRRRVPVGLLLVVGLAVALGTAFVLAAPRVLEFAPPPDAGSVPATAPIRITFSRPMDSDSVLGHLDLEPDVPFEVQWLETTLELRPESAWPEAGSIRVGLRAGARSRILLPLLTSRAWTLIIGPPRLAYLWPQNGQADLYARALGEQSSVRLTESPLGVADYTVHRASAAVFYTAESGQGRTELRRLDLASGLDELVYTCPMEARCQSVEVSPGGGWLVFERYELTPGAGGQATPGESQVWALRLRAEGAPFPIGPNDHTSKSPLWIGEDQLAYYDATLKSYAVLPLPLAPDVAPFAFIGNELGESASASPDGTFFLAPEIIFPAEDDTPSTDTIGGEAPPFFSHLYRVEIESGLTSDLSGEQVGLVEDASPAYSPDGRWIAFARKYLDRERWTLGRQLWLMAADGSSPRQLTQAPDHNHARPVWSPDGTILAYVRADLADFTLPLEIWWLDIESGEAQRLAEGGFLPQWIP